MKHPDVFQQCDALEAQVAGLRKELQLWKQAARWLAERAGRYSYFHGCPLEQANYSCPHTAEQIELGDVCKSPNECWVAAALEAVKEENNGTSD